MGAASVMDWFEIAKWIANTLAIPAVGFIWHTQARITRVETKLDILMQFHGLQNAKSVNQPGVKENA